METRVVHASTRRGRRAARGLLLLCFLAQLVAPVFAQNALPHVEPGRASDAEVKMIRGLSFDQKLGDRVPLDAVFTNEAGERVPLSAFVKDKPVVLVMPWYGCT